MHCFYCRVANSPPGIGIKLIRWQNGAGNKTSVSRHERRLVALGKYFRSVLLAAEKLLKRFSPGKDCSVQLESNLLHFRVALSRSAASPRKPYDAT
jgi:hypothetical protein